MPYIETLATLLCDTLRASSDYAQAESADSDSKRVLGFGSKLGKKRKIMSLNN